MRRIYHCECSEDAILVEKHGTNNIYICVPNCTGYTPECKEFSKGKNLEDYTDCNMEKGHCDTQCQGEGSCPDDQKCFSGVCDSLKISD